MTRLSLFVPAAILASLLVYSPAMNAQTAVPAGTGTAFRDTSMLKLPAGAKLAIFEFEDLECPACSRAFPIVHAAVEHYKIPLLRHDFPLRGHIWSFDAAVTARYLQDKVSPKLAEEFRRDVFASQTSIASKDDLAAFTANWFKTHGQQLPFVMDPAGLFTAEVRADATMGDRLGLNETPTILLLTQHGWIQIKDITQLYATIDTALAQAGPVASATTTKTATHTKTAAHRASVR